MLAWRFRAALWALLLAASGTAGAGCQFVWRHHGDVDFDMGELLAGLVTDGWCEKYPDKEAEILVITSRYYSNDQGSLGHAVIGVRKTGSRIVPGRQFSAYRRNGDLTTLGAADDLVAEAVRYAMNDMMSVVKTLKLE